MKELDRKFYEKTLRPDRQRSYKVVADVIVDYFAPSHVLDLGCGAGWILEKLQGRVTTIQGVEPNPEIASVSLVTDHILAESLEKELDLGYYDLVISTEVAEHIPESGSEVFLNNLCRHSDRIFFTAAQPGQGGYGHVNEQPLEYWRKRIRERGFLFEERTTEDVATELKRREAKSWYHKNLQIFSRI